MISIKPPPPPPPQPPDPVATVPSGPGTPYYQGFTNTLRHVTCGRTPLDEGSAQSNPKQRPVPDNTQHSHKTDIHTPSGIPNHNPSK